MPTRGYSVLSSEGATRFDRYRNAGREMECREWRLGVMSGPQASGELPQRIYDLASTPPEIRKAGLREVMEVLRCKGQVG